MKIKLLSFALLMFCTLSFAQKKIKYSKEEIDKMETYFFNEGFSKPDKKKTSTIITKDGKTYVGYCDGIDTKKGQIYEITIKDSISGKENTYNAENVKEMYVYASGWEKAIKVSKYMSNMRNWGTKSLNNNVTNDRIYFVNQKVSLKNKKDDKEFLMQLINPEFSQLISVYHDPRAKETGGFGVPTGPMGGVQFGGGVIKSYYVKKGDKIMWLHKDDFEENYDFLFGDNTEFIKKYPKNSVKWDFLSYLVLEYTNMSLPKE
ncbi:hypothetical protein [Moheibacter sediminis]|uniref:Uncharacterized protein n=1 Tax=Moheibacter sediminis TaxID=1434700 RepID=A0A1W1Z265_9FLAO|nr:hypothetical protein [Moheibacter sediminis]SMC42545.1 hypothetical protein SAMN06296427_102129 [Moheibacter sediminis]